MKLIDRWYNIIYSVQGFFENVHRVISWIPIVWKDRDWDYAYLLNIIRYKLGRMEYGFEHFDIGAEAQKRAREVHIANLLLDRIKKDEYDSQYEDAYNEKWHLNASDITTSGLLKHDISESKGWTEKEKELYWKHKYAEVWKRADR